MLRKTSGRARGGFTFPPTTGRNTGPQVSMQIYRSPRAIISSSSRTHRGISVGSVGMLPTASAPSLTAWSSVRAAG